MISRNAEQPISSQAPQKACDKAIIFTVQTPKLQPFPYPCQHTYL